MRRIWRSAARGIQSWAQWMEKRGFIVTLMACVIVIIGSAVWARIPTAPEETSQQTEVNFAQRLAEVLGPRATPEPEAQPSPTPIPKWERPVPGEVARKFSPVVPLYSQTYDAYIVHIGVDLKTTGDEPVRAPFDGTVISSGNNERLGLMVEIANSGGDVIRIMGLSTLDEGVGAAVKAGDILGRAGGVIPMESQDAPHLHIELFSNGKLTDPSEKW